MADWQEVESKVHYAGYWLAYLASAVFVSIGGVGVLAFRGPGRGGAPLWLSDLFFGVFALFGCALGLVCLRSVFWPTYVRHAAPGVLPNVPKEPVVCEGSVVHGRLTHELCETAKGWELRPAETIRRNDKRFLLGFGAPFMTLFSAGFAWILHSQMHFADWPLSAACSLLATLLCGGSALLLMAMMMRAGYRRLSKLTCEGDRLELESAAVPDSKRLDLAEGLKWAFLGEAQRQRLTIPRELVAAVQLCPWKYMVGQGLGTTWAVQGLLVLSPLDGAAYSRLPLTLTSDFAGAARLMQRLACTLQVPYLFCADATGWKAEAMRAKSRPPMRTGGMQT